MTKFASGDSERIAREQIEADRAILQRSRQEFGERVMGKPTPTQEENDLAACGAHITEHEPDGSPPDPFATRSLEAKPGGGYETRDMKPAQRASSPSPKPPVA